MQSRALHALVRLCRLRLGDHLHKRREHLTLHGVRVRRSLLPAFIHVPVRYQSDGVRLFLDIQKRFKSPVMTRVIERILRRAFRGSVEENSLLMRLPAERLFAVLQSNMMRLVPKVLRALKHRLEMYHRPIFSSLVVSQQTITSFSSLDFGTTCVVRRWR